MSSRPSILWIRQDLRLSDNPALAAAAAKGGAIIPLYIWAPEEEGHWPYGAASRWWLHRSLECLQKALPSLIIRRGNSIDTLLAVAKESNADAVFWNRRYEPASIRRDTQVKARLTQAGLDVKSFNGNLLFEPWTVLNKQKKPFQVFTPFWKRCLEEDSPSPPLPPPAKIAPPSTRLRSDSLESLGLLPKIHWEGGLEAAWKPGEAGAAQALSAFLPRVSDYPQERDFPAHEGVSRLSPYLHFGELSPRTVWHAVKNAAGPAGDPYLRQLGWREFAHHLLYHFPHTPERPLREDFEAFPWAEDASAVNAWQKGTTGYPIVDAGMRELWATGWMHNRVRMIVGSFLVKDIMAGWLEGARWFWDTLVDADLANNTLGWQWVGGCGADAAPYFRIFNPVLQGEKFDGDGVYVRRWVPELARLPSKWIHCPWEAPPMALREAGITLGKTYPFPIVDHAQARDRALAAFKNLRE